MRPRITEGQRYACGTHFINIDFLSSIWWVFYIIFSKICFYMNTGSCQICYITLENIY